MQERPLRDATVRRHAGLLPLLLLTWLAVGLINQPARAQVPTAVIRSEPAELFVAPGETVELTVVLTDASDLYGIDVRATFDPDLFEVIDADPATDGVQITPGSFPQPDFVVRQDADNALGSVRYAVTQVNPTAPATGSGVVFSLQLRAKAAQGRGTLALALVEMADRSGQLLAVTTENNTIEIGVQAVSQTTAPPATAVPDAQVAEPTSVPVIPQAADDPAAGRRLVPALVAIGVLAVLAFAVYRLRKS